ncbi:hypothetical protein [Methylotenera mobilis]|uniref:PilZ domain-containing protein n=1 Tax=Methylotenera mobilis (strain JLW8 / ATCC BAA-1282 / DSM 17540) TaxID=583345 RepID=C6WV48_METML|nr:hypothetical protein [Methylotenera mobilis]ACT47797.1 hypothetical protein Mmol_0888 [Methylotenera mobilis JLW8]
MAFLQNLFKNVAAPKMKSSMAWMHQLKGMDDLSAIEFATVKLGDEFKTNAFSDPTHLQALFSIDENTHITVERITTHFIHIEHISAEFEERVTNAVFFYHRQLFLIYYALIDHFSDQYQNHLHIFLARAMRNATQMIKWRYYIYQSAPANVWTQISQLYLLAEKRSLLNAKIQPYADLEPISVSNAYIHVCMLGTLESLSLKCEQIEFVSKMLSAWTGKTTVDSVFDESQHLFYVDTTANKPAKRIRTFKPASTYRYWNLDSVISKIQLCTSLIEFNISPKQPFMKELISHRDASTTFDVLNTEWSRLDYNRQRRLEERSKNVSQATTSLGFKEVCEQIKQYENIKMQRGERGYQGEKSFEERLATHNINRSEPNIIHMNISADHSSIIDQSSKGLGLHVSRHPHEVATGMLIGISTKELRNNTKLGIIKNIRPIAQGELHLGIELLSNIGFYSQAENISLRTPKVAISIGSNENKENYFANTVFANTTSFLDSSFGTDPSNFMCLYLPKEQSLSRQETLIIPKLQYNKNDIFKVLILGEEILVRFTKSFERHGNWVRVTFTTDLNR